MEYGLFDGFQMEMWWVWMFLAAVFVIGEIFTSGFFLLWFAIGAAAAGVLDLLHVGEVEQLITFIITTGILFVMGKNFADQVTDKQPPGVGPNRFVDQQGVVLEEINPEKNTGRIRIGQDEWRASSSTGEIIPVGTVVHVSKVEGVHAIVKFETKES